MGPPPGGGGAPAVHDRAMGTGTITVGVPRETFPGETRIALVPQCVPVLQSAGIEVMVEVGAGGVAGYPAEAFVEHGATIGSRDETFAADLVLQVRTLGANPDAGLDDLDRHRPGQIVVGTGEPLSAARDLAKLAERGVTVFAMELIPRIARAQSMDVLSSQSTIAGYKAVLMAAARLPKMFPMLTTAAGTVAPARVFVIGAGVAGLQSIATARRLGAMVEAYDVRPAAQEEVESLGAKLVPLPLEPGDAEDASGYAKELGEAFYLRQQEHLTRTVTGVDVVIANAAIPGAQAPILLTEEGVHAMAVGSGRRRPRGRARRQLRPHASGRDGGRARGDDLRSDEPARLGAVPREPALRAQPHELREAGARPGRAAGAKVGRRGRAFHAGGARGRDRASAGPGAARGGGGVVTEQIEFGLWIFMLATFIGFEVIRRVPPLLHTPLMSLTNAISGISLVGSIILAGAGRGTMATILGATAVCASSINVVGGFMITDRMLKSFKRGSRKAGGEAQ